jgi:hypothetical protein
MNEIIFYLQLWHHVQFLYSLATRRSLSSNKKPIKTHFRHATIRFPSPFHPGMNSASIDDSGLSHCSLWWLQNETFCTLHTQHWQATSHSTIARAVPSPTTLCVYLTIIQMNVTILNYFKMQIVQNLASGSPFFWLYVLVTCPSVSFCSISLFPCFKLTGSFLEQTLLGLFWDLFQAELGLWALVFISASSKFSKNSAQFRQNPPFPIFDHLQYLTMFLIFHLSSFGGGGEECWLLWPVFRENPVRLV